MKEKITDFFTFVGINPYLGFFIILCIVMCFKIIKFLNDDGKEKRKNNTLFDIAFIILYVTLFFLYILIYWLSR
jgi:hypothetical protein